MRASNLIAIPAIAAAVVGGLWYFWDQANYPTCTFRYKLTAEVQTPDGMKTGSSVWEVGYAHRDSAGGRLAALTLTGQALYIDLGAGKNVLLLLTNRESGRSGQFDELHGDFSDAKGPLRSFSLPIKLYGLNWDLGQEPKLCHDFEIASAKGGADIPIENLPTLVTFSDISDPASLKVVQPDRFESDFGEGYKFIGARIEATDAPPTVGLDRVLTWLPEKAPKDRSITVLRTGPLFDVINYYGFTANHTTATNGYWP